MDCKDLQFFLIKFLWFVKSRLLTLKRMSYEKDHLIFNNYHVLLCESYGQVTYTVTVPNGTNACFIAGEMTGWNQLQMTQQSTNVFTITIPYATTAQQYKYCSGPAWNFTENWCWRWKCQ